MIREGGQHPIQSIILFSKELCRSILHQVYRDFHIHPQISIR